MMQRRAAAFIGGVYFGLIIEQQFDSLDKLFNIFWFGIHFIQQRDPMQRGSFFFGVFCVHVRPIFQQKRHRRNSRKHRVFDEQRHAVFVFHVHVRAFRDQHLREIL